MRYEITHPNIENIENGVHTASALVMKVIVSKEKIIRAVLLTFKF